MGALTGPVPLCPLPVRLSLAGLLILACGCGRSGGGGRDAGAGTSGSAGAIGAGTGGASGAAGAAGTGAGGAGGTAGSAVAGAGGSAGTGAGGAGGAAGTSAAGTGGASAGGQGGASGGGGANPTDGGAAGRPNPRDAGPYHPLDMNDVTILAPLPASNAAPVLLRGADLADDGTPLIPRALFDRVVRRSDSLGSSPIVGAATFDRIQLIAVRFDLCDRPLPGACPEADDARMRLVFQPTFTDGAAQDAGFHAFYAIRNGEIDGAVAALRDLAATAPPQTGTLRVSPALSAANPGPYATKLRAFVRRYGGEARIVRLTTNAQPEVSAQVRWEFRGVEKKGDAFVDIPIFGSTAISEAVLLAGGPDFDVTPIADMPPGLRAAITRSLFDAADATKKRELLAVLAAIDNPLTHTAETVPCVGCHVSTLVMTARAQSSSIDPLALPGRYTSTFDLSTAGGKAPELSAIRAFGYLGRQPMISQRVVNETAQTLAEIEQRYPAP